jgi:hypothetical protein
MRFLRTSTASTLRSVERAVRWIPPWVLLLALGLPILIFGWMGIVQRLDQSGGWRLFNLDSERAVATYYSAGLAWVAAGLVAVAAATKALSRWAWAFAGVLAFVALDDGNAIHERLQRLSGVDWQVLYLPVLAFGGLAGWQLWRSRPADVPRRFLSLGALSWTVALILEPIQHWGGQPVAFYDPLMVSEEILEMVGAVCFALAAAAVIRSLGELPQPKRLSPKRG